MTKQTASNSHQYLQKHPGISNSKTTVSEKTKNALFNNNSHHDRKMEPK